MPSRPKPARAAKTHRPSNPGPIPDSFSHPLAPARILIRGGRVIDPASGLDMVLDLALADGKVAEIGKKLTPLPADRVIDALYNPLRGRTTAATKLMILPPA